MSWQIGSVVVMKVDKLQAMQRELTGLRSDLKTLREDHLKVRREASQFREDLETSKQNTFNAVDAFHKLRKVVLGRQERLKESLDAAKKASSQAADAVYGLSSFLIEDDGGVSEASSLAQAIAFDPDNVGNPAVEEMVLSNPSILLRQTPV